MKMFPRPVPAITANALGVTENTRLTVGAANDRALTFNEWEQITPWGMFPNPKGVQRITPAQGNAMVQAFNALKAKQGESFRGLPVYIGHPDIDPKIYKDHGRIGKITDLATKTDGLYCKVAWNDIGKKNQDEGYFVYPSGVWRFQKCAGGVIEPIELTSVGLTNVPNIAGVKPWAKNDEVGATQVSRAPADWSKRRRAGAAGRHNPVAVKVRASMRAKKAGRGVTSFDHVAAADSLEKKVVAKRAILGAGSSHSSGPGNHVHIHIASNAGAAIAQRIKEQKDLERGIGAAHAIIVKAEEFKRAGDLTDEEARLKAKDALPESAAIVGHHRALIGKAMAASMREKERKAFLDKVYARMAREQLSYTDAWIKEKAASTK